MDAELQILLRKSFIRGLTTDVLVSVFTMIDAFIEPLPNNKDRIIYATAMLSVSALTAWTAVSRCRYESSSLGANSTFRAWLEGETAPLLSKKVSESIYRPIIEERRAGLILSKLHVARFSRIRTLMFRLTNVAILARCIAGSVADRVANQFSR